MAGTSILENNLVIILKLKINTSHSPAVPILVCTLDLIEQWFSKSILPDTWFPRGTFKWPAKSKIFS